MIQNVNLECTFKFGNTQTHRNWIYAVGIKIARKRKEPLLT